MTAFATTSVTRAGLVALTILTMLLTGCASEKPVAKKAAIKQYAFWPEPPDEPHIQFLVAYNSSRDIAPAKTGFEEAIYGKDQEQALDVSKPYGVAMWNGRIYVSDIRGRGVIVLDIRKKETRVMGAGGAGAVSKASDIAVASDGTKYVVDLTQNAIVVFDADERYVQTIAMNNARPVGICVYKDLLYVADFKGQIVRVFNRYSGQELRTIGEAGGDDGKFIQPIKVATDKDGNVFVADVMRCRVQKFSPDGQLLHAFGQSGNRPGDFVRPKHLAVGSDNILFVVDAAFNNVQMFDEEDKIMMYFGSAGPHPGSMNLPAGLAINEGDLDLFQDYIHPAFQAERLIVVTNQFGDAKVSVYAMGHLKPGKTLADISNSRAKVNKGVEPEKSTTQPATAPAAAAKTSPAEKP
jgi:DNA-binding beta-propeller fold protein YncE